MLQSLFIRFVLYSISYMVFLSCVNVPFHDECSQQHGLMTYHLFSAVFKFLSIGSYFTQYSISFMRLYFSGLKLGLPCYFPETS